MKDLVEIFQVLQVYINILALVFILSSQCNVNNIKVNFLVYILQYIQLLGQVIQDKLLDVPVAPECFVLKV